MIKVINPKRHGRKVISVISEENGWSVRKNGSNLPVVVCQSKQRAVTIAKNMAKKQLPCKVQIFKKDGKVQEELLYKKAEFFENSRDTKLTF